MIYKKKPRNDDREAESDVLFVFFCSIELTTNPACDQIKEHRSSARLNRLKDHAKRTEEKTQVSLHESVAKHKNILHFDFSCNACICNTLQVETLI